MLCCGFVMRLWLNIARLQISQSLIALTGLYLTTWDYLLGWYTWECGSWRAAPGAGAIFILAEICMGGTSSASSVATKVIHQSQSKYTSPLIIGRKINCPDYLQIHQIFLERSIKPTACLITKLIEHHTGVSKLCGWSQGLSPMINREQ